MINYKDSAVLFDDQAKGIDHEITVIQRKLSAIPWLQKAFGRAIVQNEYYNQAQQGPVLKNPSEGVRLKPVSTVYPEGYTPEGEPFNLMPNDNLKSYCFFIVRDPSKYLNPDFTDPQQVIQATVSIVFWINLAKVLGTEQIDYRINELYKSTVIAIFKKCVNFDLVQSFDAYNTVFDLFTITDTYRQFMKKPYIAFRFDGTISYTAFVEDNC